MALPAGQSSKKKTAISSSNKSQTVCPDRISALPDSLIHNIFGFLDMNQVVQTSVLSKRWKSLWVSNPCVSIKFEDWAENKDDESLDFDHFKNYVDRVLLLRDGSNINTFYLDCDGYSDSTEVDWKKQFETHIYNTWIASVVKRNVQEVILQCMSIMPTSLRSLAGQIKSLTLNTIYFRCGYNELILNNHFIENLIIKDCGFGYGARFTLNASNLKSLTLDNEDNSSEIRIYAQNLMVLVIKGKMSRDYLIDNLSSLDTAFIGFSTGYFTSGVHINLPSPLSLSNLLKGLYNAKSLTLSAYCFQDFPEVPQLLDSLAAFQNLGFLKLTELDGTKYICVIAKLLEKFPNLETLVLVGIEYDYSDSEGKGGDWEAQLSPCMPFDHLKTIEIRNPHECVNFYKFLEFLLKNAVDLESIVMTATTTQSTDETTKLVKVGKKLEVAPKSSSKVKIFLKERDGTVKEI